MILLVLLVEVWAFAFFGVFGSELLGTYPLLRIVAQVLFVAPLAIWAVLRLRGPRTPVDWAILIGLGAMVVVSLTSHDPEGSLESLGLALAYALAFWALREAGARPRIRTAVAIAITYAFAFWLVMVSIWWIAEKVTWVGSVGTFPNLESNQVFIWGTANVFPILSLLSVAFLAWLPPGLPRRVLTVIWIVTAVVVIPLSVGRAAWGGFVVAGLAYEAICGFPHVRGGARWLRERRLGSPSLALGLVTLSAVVGILAIKGDAIVEANLADRIHIWSEAMGIFAASPLTGGGPSTYSWLRLSFVPDYTYAVPVRLTHNVFFETLADGGLVLVVAFLVLLVSFTLRALRFRTDPRRRLTLAVLAGYAAASLLDDFSSLPAVIVAVIALAAWTVADQTPPTSASPPAPLRTPLQLALPAVAVVLALSVLPSVVSVDRARAFAAQARADAVAGRWARATSGFETATSLYSTDAGYWLGLGLARWHADDVAGARAAYLQASDLSPGDARAWGARAALATNATDRIAWLDRASRLTITDPQYALRLGNAELAAGMRHEALLAYGIAVGIDPSLITLFDAGTATIPASEVATAARQVAAALHGGDGTVVSWDLSLALRSLPADAGPAWQAVTRALKGDLDEARLEAAAALRIDPYYGYGLPAEIAVARYTCDRAAYDRLSGQTPRIPLSRPGALAIIREHTYREDSLGDYQPLTASPLPMPQPWPWSLVGAPPACPGWST